MGKPQKRIKLHGPIEELNNEDLVEIIRGNTRKHRKEDAYNILQENVKVKIFFIIRQFYIPGFNYDDIYQEALYALRFKAIPDYDSKRGKRENPYPFEKFAMLCIRRHLSTILKGSFQNKKKTLNTSLSLDQDRGSFSDENLFLSEVLPRTKGTIVENLSNKEFYHNLFKKLYKTLSLLEQRVLALYTCKYSYDEISKILNDYSKKNGLFGKRTNIKSIDNALSRIKQKAKEIYDRYEAENL